jgi:hypothetical protein
VLRVILYIFHLQLVKEAEQTLQRTREVVLLSLASSLAAELGVVRLRKYEYKNKVGGK